MQNKKQYAILRFNSLNQEKLNKCIEHNYRFTKSQRDVRDDMNYALIVKDNKLIEGRYAHSQKLMRAHGEELKEKFNDIQTKHGKLVYKETGKSLSKKRVNSMAEGLLGFSDSSRQKYEENPTKFWNKCRQSVADICQHYGIELFSMFLHVSEEGNPHVHFITTNFNTESGEVVGWEINKNRSGEIAQDLVAKQWQDWGFERGENGSEARHLSVEDYKKSQATLELDPELKKLNEIRKSEKMDVSVDRICEILAELEDYPKLGSVNIEKFYDIANNHREKGHSDKLGKMVIKLEKRLSRTIDKFDKINRNIYTIDNGSESPYKPPKPF